MASQRRGRGSARSKRDFWGEEAPTDFTPSPIRPSEFPTALVQSLGPLPFPRGEVSQHYFSLVYERAVTLATALAASADLFEDPYETVVAGDD